MNKLASQQTESGATTSEEESRFYQAIIDRCEVIDEGLKSFSRLAELLVELEWEEAKSENPDYEAIWDMVVDHDMGEVESLLNQLKAKKGA